MCHRSMIETVFAVPRLREASVAAGACCPVPAAAILLPELESIPGVVEADASWEDARITVVHEPSVSPAQLAAVLAEFGYPVA
ncbi:MAG: hypothetical protein JO023_01620 [Chloroflexi bacterium]|nr:hypothetical protein [Chloroflexota bacterium]